MPWTNETRKKIHRYLKIFALVLLLISLVIGGINIRPIGLSEITGNPDTILFSAGMLLFAFILFLITKQIRVYTYSYDSPFPTKFVIEPMHVNRHERAQYKNKAFFHVKHFIIDDKIAFLGYVNLTNKGMSYNVESRIAITQKDTPVAPKTSPA